jgi:hypothetical protein
MKPKKPAESESTDGKRWTIKVNGKAHESYLSEVIARRRYYALRGSQLGPDVKLYRPDGTEKD